MEDQKNVVLQQVLELGLTEADFNRAWNCLTDKSSESIINWLMENPAPQFQQETTQNQININQAQKDDNVVVVPQNKNVEKIVNKDLVDEVMTKGFNLLIAQKAVLLSGNKSTEEALKWIENHKADKDFNEPIEVEAPPKLSPEEARLKAKQLQEQIRQKALAEDKKNALEQEKLRLQMGKNMSDAQRIMKEQQKKIAIQQYMKEKQKTENEKMDMLKQLEEDKKRRFGENYKIKDLKKVKTIQEEFDEIYDKMYKIYRMNQLSMLHTCIKTIRIYLKNIIAKPDEIKYRKINSENKNFCKKIKDVIGGTNLLELMDFKLTEGYFVMSTVNLDKLNKVITRLDTKLTALSTML